MKPIESLNDVIKDSHLEKLSTWRLIDAPKFLRSLLGLIIFLMLIITAALYFTPWVQTAYGKGQVTVLNPTDQILSIQALSDGRVNEWYVGDGDFVKQGDPIVQIIDLDPQLLERLAAERLAISKKLDAARSATATAQIDYKRQESLFKQGLVSRSKYEKASIKFQEMLSKEASVAAELNQVDVKLARQSSQIVTAPRDGVIFQLLQSGTSSLVKQGDPLVTFAPEEVKNAVEITVSGLDAALVIPGRKVRLEFEGWPVIQLSGWPSHAIGTFGGIVQSVDPAVSTNGRFRVLIVQDKNDLEWPDKKFLRIGAKVRAWVTLDTVKLGYEIWRKINGFPPNPIDLNNE